MSRTGRSSPNQPLRRVTAKEVAKLAGVSFSAVSRAFTKGASVSPKTRAKVLGAAKKLRYLPNAHARSLMTRRTELIGLVANNFDNPAMIDVFDLFTRRLQHHGLRPLLANLSWGERTDDALNMLLQYNVDGVIVASSTLPSSFAEDCHKAHIPVVLAFNRTGKRQKKIDVVSVDNAQGGELAGQLLRDRGYRRIAYLGGPPAAYSTEDRLKGLTTALAAGGLKPRLIVYGESYSHEVGLQLMRRLLLDGHVKRGAIDAVFCGDDVLAMGALDACREMGVRVPDDVGVIGFNDVAMAAWPSYELTTIHQPIPDIILTAVDHITTCVQNPGKKASTLLFECSSVVRKTLRSSPT